MSIAHRFGAEGYRVALISRSTARHPDYLQSLAQAGIDAIALAADLGDSTALRAAVETIHTRFGRIDVGYYGPSSLSTMPGNITDLTGDEARDSLEYIVPAVDFVSLVLPQMRERGSGGLLFAGGLSAVVPMPALGGLTLTSAAMRNYALTLHAAVAADGVYAGTLTIGGMIERSAIAQMVAADAGAFGDGHAASLNPDDLAETAWRLFTVRSDAEAVIDVLTA